MLNARPTAPADVMAEFIRLWGRGDLTTAFTFMHDDCVYSLHLDEDLVPIGGVSTGRANIEPAMRHIRTLFEYLVWRPIKISASGPVVRVQLEFLYRHIASGELHGGNCRFLFEVVDGLITRAEEFHDRAKFEAFLRLFTQGAPAQAEAATCGSETVSPQDSKPRAVTLA